MRRLLALAAATAAVAALPAAATAQTPAVPFDALAPLGVPALITALPFERFTPDTITVSKSTGVAYANLDTEWHDVVAKTATRPDGSAPWCAQYPLDPEHPEIETCPLFWTPLLPPGAGDPQGVLDRRSDTTVRGLEDAKVGETYTFICSIHPRMTGTIEVTE